LFKVCPEWKPQQKILWAEVWKKTGRGKSWFTIRGLFANTRFKQAVLDLFSTMGCGKAGPG